MKPKKSSPIKARKYWRSLNHLEQNEEYQQWLHREFPEGASEMNNDWSRRNFLALMGASLALAGLEGCRRPVEKIVPYVERPEEVVPGNPLYFATSMPYGMGAYGLLVKSREGRPVFIEGNKLHPVNKGSANIFVQAEILNLYDPDRSKRISKGGVESSWEALISFWRGQHEQYRSSKGKGLAVIAPAVASPTVARLRRDFDKQFPNARWVTYEPVSDENIYGGIRLATGETRQPVYSYDRAKVILSLDSDFLRLENDDIPAARGFSDGRRVETRKDDMNRLYVVESTLSVTGTNADHRLPVASHNIGGFALGLLKELRNQGLAVMPGVEFDDSSTPEFDRKWIQALAKDLIRAKGGSLVVAGRRQPAAVHAIVYAINDALGNVGNTVNYHELRDVAIPNREDLAGLVDEMNRGSIETLLILNTNPVYTAPEDLQFGKALKKVKHAIELAPYVAETTPMVEWHIPMAHFLESWGDTRATDGARSVIQPLIEPLFNGRSIIEVLGLVTSGRDLRGYDIVRETWKDIIGGGDFEAKWRKVLHDGLLTEKLPSVSNPKTKGRPTTALISEITSLIKSRPEGMEVVFVPGDLYDGRYANNGWLMELADPITKLTWDNPAMISYKAAKSLGVKSGDMVKIDFDGRSLTMPVWVTPGQAENTVTLVLGYGRDLNGRVADGAGFDTYRLRTMRAFDFGSGATLTKTGESYELANTQEHGSMEGRPIVREATLAEYKKEAEFYPEQIEHPPLLPLWTPHSYAEGYQWGMTIDLNACIGCGACTVACQSENNIPIVGKQHVSEGREMQWIRVDRYYASDNEKQEEAHENPEVLHQPVPCQQCENAPCESVCPVAATVHDREGLNVMVYNRCIGTRYCSNNCPYKVRRFNFFNYTSKTPEVEKMSKNPEVTVRSRGVMEKCTYCVQRIVKAKDHAKLEGRQVQDGEIVTACQQVCPAQAIVFGNINDPDSKVSKMKKLDRSYNLLEELNTKPRTSYLAKLRNPNPELAGKRHG